MRRLLIPHLALWIVGAALIRIALVPAEVCPPVTGAAARASAVAAGQWLERGLMPDDRFTYGYHRDTDTVPNDYHPVRHAAATLSLYMLVEEGEEAFLPAAERGLRYMLDNQLETADWSAFAETGQNAQLGANGLNVAALAARRRALSDPAHDDSMRAAGAFLVGQQLPNGGMLAFWDQSKAEPIPDRFGIFATGEAFWGLALLNTTFPDEGWDAPAEKVAHYLANDRDRLEGQVTRYPDHWAAYGMAELGAGLDQDLLEYAQVLGGFFSLRTRVEAQRRGEGINLLVRGFPGPPSGVATSAEGMAALWRLGGEEPALANLRDGLADDLECYAGMMVATQIDSAEASAYRSPDLAEGAWFYRDYSQIDDQFHNVAALVATLPVLEGP